jgi:predicted nucleic acid-binding protein
MVVFDSAALTLLLWDKAKGPVDSTTGEAVTHCKERMELLVQTLHKSKQTIIIPSPVLAEVLTVSGKAGLKYVAILQKAAVFRLESFDTRAAIELAEMSRVILASGDKKAGIEAPWQKIKTDRQIVAIARVAGAKTLYTNDGSLKSTAESVGLKVIGVEELPVPQEDGQGDLLEVLERQAAAMSEGNDAEAAAEEEEA